MIGLAKVFLIDERRHLERALRCIISQQLLPEKWNPYQALEAIAKFKRIIRRLKELQRAVTKLGHFFVSTKPQIDLLLFLFLPPRHNSEDQEERSGSFSHFLSSFLGPFLCIKRKSCYRMPLSHCR